MKIRAKNGDVHDFEELRASAKLRMMYKIGDDSDIPAVKISIDLVDALECVLSIPCIQYRDGASSFDHAHALSRNATLREVREAAGIIEDAP